MEQDAPHNPADPPGDESSGQTSVVAPAESKPPIQREPTADETVKETIESIVIAFILAFVFRAFIVEPFIIPTGSMAPTLLGAHLQMHCPSCGYRFDVGIDSSEVPEGASLENPKGVDCPMCNYQVVADVGTKVRSGDRILVDKFSYHLTDPSRWDVVVFKAPQGEAIGNEPAPRTNFIKRLVGLPGERVCLLDGNVFVAPAGTEDFTIARKTDPSANRHWQAIQRAIWQPIYHSQFVPIDDARATGPNRDERHAWRVPWVIERGDWELGTPRSPSRVYRFAGGDGEIRFEMDGPYGTPRYDRQSNKYPYNRDGGSLKEANAIEDIRLACAVMPKEDGGATIRLLTTARLDRPDKGIETLVASFTRDGAVALTAVSADGEERRLGTPASVAGFKRGVATSVELWLVDDEASVWVNGERVIVQRFDLTWAQIAMRPEPPAIPDVRIAIDSEGEVELRRVELDRDLYYFPDRYPSTGFARAEARRSPEGIRIGPDPLELRTRTGDHDPELFVLGDNQPASKDGRSWTDVDGWVRQRYFGGDERAGVVPRSLLVGRAFMVYYPAPHGSSPQAKGIFPDFGRVRFIH